MRKIFTILSITSSLVFANAQNLVQNPGFETGTLSPWAAGWNSNYTAPNVIADAHTGGFGANYAATATTGFFQNVNVTAGQQYTLSFWYKISGTGNGGRIWSNFLDAGDNPIYLVTDSANDPLRNNNQFLTKSTTWQQKVITFTVPANATRLQLHLRAYSSSNVSFDDFSLTTGTLAVGEVAASKYRLVKNTFIKDNGITFGANVKDVKVYNMYGQVVKTASVKENEILNVSELQKGNYIVTGLVNNEPVSQKILKD
ncbi:carbohydrate binding domain-containing protein [Chryseobacterium paridis]|uniref:Carbohydrate binding domain-containing protein n=1 Tax=Chryseobacterium paridis TaxID=2800328 RepID=A0ABS1FZW3_9FLAO|nr:carbohydrate binding domain-containing protein [Chryseobacterium paridis]MBK1897935.1 carbohydrate binding domain-containing protein [Chryseobacterium paridis]